MKIKTISFVAVAAVAALFAGCEWTSSDGNPTWSGMYGDGGDAVEGMNFSGTYRNDARGGCAYVTKSGNSNQNTNQSSANGNAIQESFAAWVPNSSTTIVLKNIPNAGTVSVSVTLSNYDQYKQEMVTEQWSWVNDGAGNLTGNTEAAGKGKVDGHRVTLYGYLPRGTEKDVVKVSYIIDSTTNGSSSNSTVAGNGSVAAITISQSGSGVKLHTSNGITMSGTITTVNVYSNATSVTYNAQFNASSGGNSIVGTLDNRTGQNRLDGTWTSGDIIYDVNGFSSTSVTSSIEE